MEALRRDGTIPCITLILGGNLTQGNKQIDICKWFLIYECVLEIEFYTGVFTKQTGLRSSKIKPMLIVGVVCTRFIILPATGILIVKLANHLGFLPSDPLFLYTLMVQFTLPPAMNVGKYLNPVQTNHFNHLLKDEIYDAFYQ